MSYFFTGKTIEEATDKGLAELNLSKDDVDILVIDAPSKGIFGFGAKQARIQIIKKSKPAAVVTESVLSDTSKAEIKSEIKNSSEKTEECCDNAPEQTAENAEIAVKPVPVENPSEEALLTRNFLTGLFEKLGLNANADVVCENDEHVVFNIVTEDSSFIIGYRGEVLDSIQTLAGAVYNTDKEKYLRVVADCEGYRAKREKTLVNLAKKLAQKAIRTGRKITLEPMTPFERRIIHSALVDFKGVKTVSEGREPNRFVAVIPDGYDPSKDKRRLNHRNDRQHEKNNFSNRGEQRKEENKDIKKAKTTNFGSGVFLGNSLKDKDNKEE